MVQILPRPESSTERFAKAFGNVATSLAQSIPEELMERQERTELSQLLGKDIRNIRNPELMRQFTQAALQQKTEQSRREQELKEGLMDYETVKKFAGEDVADFYKAATIGGKTKIMDAIVDSLKRGEKFGEALSGTLGPEIEEIPHPEITEISKKGEKLDLPDYTKRPKGTTPKSWEETRKGWTKSNVETLDKAREKLRGNKRDVLGTKKLIKLNDSHELPEGLERWIINPKTGEIYGAAQLTGQAPTAAQEWVKEVARFGNRAKDAYGSRVTNFDLYQYMKQFPSLLNTPDGRRNILRMMEINYELDSLYDKAVQKIIDQKGAGNIPPEEVDRVARGLISHREEQLFNEYLNLDADNEASFLTEGLSQQRPSLEDIFGG